MRRFLTVLAGVLAAVTAGCNDGYTAAPLEPMEVRITVPLGEPEVPGGIVPGGYSLPLVVTLHRVTTGELVHLDSIDVVPEMRMAVSQARILAAPGGEDLTLRVSANAIGLHGYSFGPQIIRVSPRGGTIDFVAILHSARWGFSRIAASQSAAALFSGESLDLDAVVRDSLGFIVQEQLVWSSSDAAVVSVDGTGRVTAGAEAAGTATITVASASGQTATIPVSVTRSRDRFVDLAAGSDGTCGLTVEGVTYCWHQAVSAPTRMASLPPLRSLEGSEADRICGLTPGGTAWCWRSRPAAGREPYAVRGPAPFIQISVGTSPCALTTGRLVYCWSEVDQAPVQLVTQIRPDYITTGGREMLCAGEDGRVYCNNVDRRADTLVQVKSSERLVAAAPDGSGTACVLNATGDVRCVGAFDDSFISWGAIYFDKSLCRGGSACDIPTPLTGTTRLASITAGDQFFCGLAGDGEAFCWGFNGWGNLGIGNTVASCFNACAPQPTPVRTQYRFSKVTLGLAHACGLTAEGRALCWGNNNGRLGFPTTLFASSPTPVPVTGERR